MNSTMNASFFCSKISKYLASKTLDDIWVCFNSASQQNGNDDRNPKLNQQRYWQQCIRQNYTSDPNVILGQLTTTVVLVLFTTSFWKIIFLNFDFCATLVKAVLDSNCDIYRVESGKKHYESLSFITKNYLTNLEIFYILYDLGFFVCLFVF